ncbi:hypothetical protein [Cupriavidus oxalaticus]|uniref:hypothetical protein n=1 Tax=Cupriavidus oxalaticus TaxID=96344 RepID=UPI00316F9930
MDAISTGAATAWILPFGERRPVFDVTAIERDAESPRTEFANTLSSTDWPTIIADMTAG